jgi:hypothetical protein
MKTWKIMMVILIVSVIATMAFAFLQLLVGPVNLLIGCLIAMPFLFIWAKKTES